MNTLMSHQPSASAAEMDPSMNENRSTTTTPHAQPERDPLSASGDDFTSTSPSSLSSQPHFCEADSRVSLSSPTSVADVIQLTSTAHGPDRECPGARRNDNGGMSLPTMEAEVVPYHIHHRPIHDIYSLTEELNNDHPSASDTATTLTAADGFALGIPSLHNMSMEEIAAHQLLLTREMLDLQRNMDDLYRKISFRSDENQHVERRPSLGARAA